MVFAATVRILGDPVESFAMFAYGVAIRCPEFGGRFLGLGLAILAVAAFDKFSIGRSQQLFDDQCTSCL